MKGGKRQSAGTSRENGSKDAAGTTVEMARQLAAIVEAHSLSELVVNTPELTMTLRRGSGYDGLVAPASLSAAPPPAPMSFAAAAPASAPPAVDNPAASPAPPAAPDGHMVTSPFVGTFYRSPTPDSDPYVAEGQRVEKGQVLCIVEAMKLMNEIEADKAGVVAAVMVQNGQPVEYGQALFRISPRLMS